MDRIHASNNRFDQFVYTGTCSVNNLSLFTSEFNASDGIWVRQSCSCGYDSCSSSRVFVLEMENCYFSTHSGISIAVSRVYYLQVRINSCIFSNASGFVTSPGIYIQSVPYVQTEGNEQKVIPHTVTMENLSGTDSSYPLENLRFAISGFTCNE